MVKCEQPNACYVHRSPLPEMSLFYRSCCSARPNLADVHSVVGFLRWCTTQTWDARQVRCQERAARSWYNCGQHDYSYRLFVWMFGNVVTDFLLQILSWHRLIWKLQNSVFEQGNCKMILLSQYEMMYVGRCRQLCGQCVQTRVQ